MPSRWLADAAPPTLGAIAEGAWIAVLGAAVAAPLAAAGGPRGDAWQLLPYLIAALIGAVAARRLPTGPARPAALFGLAVMVALIALLAHRIIWTGAIGSAPTDSAQPLAVDILLGFAVLRGAVQGDPGAGADAIDALVRHSPFLLTIGWALGLAIGGDGRATFVSAAALATSVFVLAAALALGAGRLAMLTHATDDNERGNGPWLVLVAVVVACALVVGIPLSVVVGRPLGAITGGIVGLVATGVILVAGGIVGVLVVAVDAFVGFVRSLLDSASTKAPPPASPPVAPQQPLPAGSHAFEGVLEPIVTVALLVVIIALAWYLANRWQGRDRRLARSAAVAEHRSIVLDARATLPSLRLSLRHRPLGGPHGALDAYPRLLDEWAAIPLLARGRAETPAAHATRLGAGGATDPALQLLVADFQLARFGAVALTPAEDRRAVRRYHRLRRRGPSTSGPEARDP